MVLPLMVVTVVELEEPFTFTLVVEVFELRAPAMCEEEFDTSMVVLLVPSAEVDSSCTTVGVGAGVAASSGEASVACSPSTWVFDCCGAGAGRVA